MVPSEWFQPIALPHQTITPKKKKLKKFFRCLAIANERIQGFLTIKYHLSLLPNTSPPFIRFVSQRFIVSQYFSSLNIVYLHSDCNSQKNNIKYLSIKFLVLRYLNNQRFPFNLFYFYKILSISKCTPWCAQIKNTFISVTKRDKSKLHKDNF